jgi:CRP/FNR family cyclic AMP-dependent transcriptional regulator
MSARANPSRAVYLSEVVDHLDEGANFFDRLSAEQQRSVRRLARPLAVPRGKTVFRQGAPHAGIYLIEEGVVRSYYTFPSGREITLAYWTRGHFVGGPEIFGGGEHIWSGEAVENVRLLHLSGDALRTLTLRTPQFAIALVEGLVAKSKCYSALVHMLGTRSATERLAQLLIILGKAYGRSDGNRLVIEHRVTHNQLATIIGATRQWVTVTLDRFRRKGIISVGRRAIVIESLELLLEWTGDRKAGAK